MGPRRSNTVRVVIAPGAQVNRARGVTGAQLRRRIKRRRDGCLTLRSPVFLAHGGVVIVVFGLPSAILTDVFFGSTAGIVFGVGGPLTVGSILVLRCLMIAASATRFTRYGMRVRQIWRTRHIRWEDIERFATTSVWMPPPRAPNAEDTTPHRLHLITVFRRGRRRPIWVLGSSGGTYRSAVAICGAVRDAVPARVPFAVLPQDLVTEFWDA